VDPEETYRRIAVAMARLQPLLEQDPDELGNVARAAHLADVWMAAEVAATAWADLNEWLSNGGFAPSAWDPALRGGR
jgi:hypothetical protein